MMESMTIREIMKACDGEFIGGENIFEETINHITIDSRTVEHGSLYIPVIGENNDGHIYIDSAFKSGALCCLSEIDVKYPHIKVGSTFKALKDIAEYYRCLFDIKVIAITGSVGKTTAKDMIYSILSQKYSVLKTMGNFNNEFGLPQTLFNLNKTHDIAVLEMGMNSFGEISRLSKTARPDVCVILNIGVSHIGRLGSKDGILKAKSEIFDYVKKDAKVYLNGDDDKLITLKDNNISPIYFGAGEENHAKLKKIIKADIKGTEFTCDYKNEEIKLKIYYPGEYLISSALAGVAIGKDFGLTADQIEKGIAEFSPSNMRMEITQTSKIMILDDTYNACPESILAGVEVLEHAQGRKVAIIGDILELDEFAQKIHYETGQKIAKKKVDLIICTGELSEDMYKGAEKTIGDRAIYFKTQEEMINSLKDIIIKGDTVYIKASRGLKLEKTVEFLMKEYK